MHRLYRAIVVGLIAATGVATWRGAAAVVCADPLSGLAVALHSTSGAASGCGADDACDANGADIAPAVEKNRTGVVVGGTSPRMKR
ncbi:MAG TPA: hypothetical protein VFS43_46490 [Polyangiaceae bacterium]|nr:hypothetical protein [Polyangiaceae bacterium]